LEQVFEFFSKLFLAESWPPRWHCGRWTDFHGWLYIISDLAIWAAYFAIPFFLFRFVTKKKDIPLPFVFWLFVAFIFLCGLTHLADAAMFYWPAYRLNGLIRFITALSSWGTVIALFKIFPHALKLKTSGEFEVELAHRRMIEIKLTESQNEAVARSEELNLKNKELEQFTYIASHDLQEPLNTISGFMKLLQKEAGTDNLSKDAQEYISYALDATDRMKNLIAHLLDYAKLGSNSISSEIDCNILATEVVKDLSAKIKETGAIVNINKLPVIQGYATELRLLFQNLIGNALKFKKQDTGTIPHINISASKVENGYKFAVEDNGIGIKAKHLDNIFNVFQRLHTDTAYDGSGIGLAHCKKIVELHGGKIWVESEFGAGSTFYFTIPGNK
jgi:signal transduction histidine kinase